MPIDPKLLASLHREIGAVTMKKEYGDTDAVLHVLSMIAAERIVAYIPKEQRDTVAENFFNLTTDRIAKIEEMLVKLIPAQPAQLTPPPRKR